VEFLRSPLAVLLLALLGGCSGVLPKSTETSDSGSHAWRSYREAEATFEQIVPGKTTLAELRALHLDPQTNPNITLLHGFEVRQKFIVNQYVTLDDLDEGVRACVTAGQNCVGWNIDQTSTQTRRTGNVALDLLKMKRETETQGWRFTGLLLIRDGVVVYKLTGGQPLIRQVVNSDDALGPLQMVGSKLNGINGINVTDVRNGVKSGDSTAGHVDPVTATRIHR
jgi:hypothetical protein